MRIKNYTPVFDRITQELDPLASLVFGRIWRYAQMGNGCCEASLQTLAADTGLSVTTVRRRIESLMKADYLSEKEYEIGTTRKLTPNYDVMVVGELVRVPESNTPPATEEGEGVSESNTKKDSKKLKESYADAIRKGLKLAAVIRADFQEYLGLSPNWETKSNQEHYRFFRERYDTGQTAEGFLAWWKEDWKGKDGSLPSSMNQVRTLWAQAFMKEKEDRHKYRKGR